MIRLQHIVGGLSVLLVLVMVSVVTANYDVDVNFTLGGDDGTDGICTGYVLRMVSTDDDASATDSLYNYWEDCTMACDTIWNTGQLPAGTYTEVVANNVPVGHWYFAIRGFDEVGNTADCSNIIDLVIEDTTPPAACTDLSF